jgi:hypothetical protein
VRGSVAGLRTSGESVTATEVGRKIGVQALGGNGKDSVPSFDAMPVFF